MICTCPRGCMWEIAARSDAKALNLCIPCYESLSCLRQRHGDNASAIDHNWRSLAQLLTAENERLHAELDTLKLAHSGCMRTYRPAPFDFPLPTTYAVGGTVPFKVTYGHLATDGNA